MIQIVWPPHFTEEDCKAWEEEKRSSINQQISGRVN